MNITQEILSTNNPIGVAWIAATVKHSKKLTKRLVLRSNIEELIERVKSMMIAKNKQIEQNKLESQNSNVDENVNPSVLRISATLLLGVVVIFQKKVNMVLSEGNTFLMSLDKAKKASSGLFSSELAEIQNVTISVSKSPNGKKTKKVVANIGAITILAPKNNLLAVDDDFFSRMNNDGNFFANEDTDEEDAISRAWRSKLLEAAETGGLKKTFASNFSTSSSSSHPHSGNPSSSVFKVSDIVSERSNNNLELHLQQQHDLLSAPLELDLDLNMEVDIIQSERLGMPNNFTGTEEDANKNLVNEEDDDGYVPFIPAAVDDDDDNVPKPQQNDAISESFPEVENIQSELDPLSKKPESKKRKRTFSSNLENGKPFEDEDTQLDVDVLKSWLSNTKDLQNTEQSSTSCKKRQKEPNPDEVFTPDDKLFIHFPLALQEFFGFQDLNKLSIQDFIDSATSRSFCSKKRRKNVEALTQQEHQPSEHYDPDEGFFIPPTGDDDDQPEMMRRDHQNPKNSDDEQMNLWFEPPTEFGDGKCENVDDLNQAGVGTDFENQEFTHSVEIDENDEIQKILKSSNGISASSATGGGKDERSNLMIAKLKKEFEIKSDEVDLEDLIKNTKFRNKQERKEASAILFFQTLILATQSVIKVEQKQEEEGESSSSKRSKKITCLRMDPKFNKNHPILIRKGNNQTWTD